MITQINHHLFFSPFIRQNRHNQQHLSHCSVNFKSPSLSHIPNASLSVPSQSNSNPFFAARISRLTRTEVERALFDYLHYTRSLSFNDAEHMSKNAPRFVEQLVLKIDNEEDLTRSLTKYLRYHPINEFEPFFESLGLKPSEFSDFLPQHLTFLSDDSVMVDNFHVLCDYGIPRSKIGKMYKEAREIFGYEHGVLAVKLQAYENLGLSRTTVIKLVSCCPTLLIGDDVDKDFSWLLGKMKVLGMNKDWIGEYVSGKNSFHWNRIVDTVDFLERVGYNDKKLRTLVKKNPDLFFQGSGKQVYILVGRLLKLGFKMNEICPLFIEKNPQLLSGKSLKNLLHGMDFLFDIRMEIEVIAKIVSSHPELLGSCSLKGPKTICRELKVKKDGLCHIIREDPMKLFTLASKSPANISELMPARDANTHLEKAAFLLRLGYVENSEEMTKALKKFRGRGDQLQERFDCLVEAGLDNSTVSSIVKQAPNMLNQNKDLIEKKIDSLKNCLGYPVDAIVKFPAFLCYDLEKIIRRFQMYSWTRDKGTAKPSLSLSTILACSDARFVKYFVDVHPDGPAMWESLNESSLSR
ncbi:hypothetical protein ACFE04_029504 [Oxalis oulophora]